ncbi:MAG: hypothetical protein J6I76_17445 [Oribacterium sp.]|nr:hypothetical protein [Oribacterium sp.]
MSRTYYNGVKGDDDSICYMFHGFIKMVIRYKALNAIRSYMLPGKREELTGDDIYVRDRHIEDKPCIEKISVDLCATIFYVEDEGLAKALDTLSIRQKQVIGYIYALDLSPEEAARMMKISVHGVYTHKGRALRALRKELTGDADYG